MTRAEDGLVTDTDKKYSHTPADSLPPVATHAYRLRLLTPRARASTGSHGATARRSCHRHPLSG